MGHGLGDGGGGPLIHHVALLLLRRVVKSGEGGDLLGGVWTVPQAPGGDGREPVLASAEQLAVGESMERGQHSALARPPSRLKSLLIRAAVAAAALSTGILKF